MSCEHLICAQCAGPVVEGRCPVCRAGREKLHDQGWGGISPALVVMVLIALLFLTLALKHLAGG
ncbi:hypothetical protein HNP84_004592 [Thermocatellispora tengchongensis]|uniref:RING-type domain-containing protein n=1 Tax=Thermocatellispora tengchongensis TaxID=1073253 RepID=A0A840P5A8_9ACTN|nr:hypothetical protein [Thermocatellispora tengchongensis]MBB5134858.1 hypothetical protein [Thermocatellispora tengchongensis]